MRDKPLEDRVGGYVKTGTRRIVSRQIELSALMHLEVADMAERDNLSACRKTGITRVMRSNGYLAKHMHRA